MIEPWLHSKTPEPEKERLQSPEERRQARRLLRMHPLLLLHLGLPEPLVERRSFPRSRRASPGLALADRQPRRGDRRTARHPRRPVPALPVPHHPQLHPDLPEGTEPRQGHRRDQENGDRAPKLTTAREWRSTMSEFHGRADQTAFSQHSDLPAAAHVGPLDRQSHHRRRLERLSPSAGRLADRGGHRTTGLCRRARRHRVLDRSDRAVRMHLRLFSASLRRHPASGLGRRLWIRTLGRSTPRDGPWWRRASALTVAAWVVSSIHGRVEADGPSTTCARR